jgi:60 kDa SS-A/Ro ribonucleoprotein
VKTHGLVREHLPTALLQEVTVWRALLQSMPMTAMIRNLGKMSAIGLLASGAPEEELIVERLGDVELLKRARIHPIAILIALRTYGRGRGLKGKLQWEINGRVLDALDGAFYKSFATVRPTGKRYLHGIDVSGSMDFYKCNGTEVLTARDVACALSMVTARTEPLENNSFIAFAGDASSVDPAKTQGTLEEFIRYCQSFNFAGTYCEMPILHALKKKIPVDVFVVYTDCETSHSAETPAAALRRYRRVMNIPEAKMVVVAATSTGFSLADPEDPNMLDIAGFDPSVTSLITEFVNGKL